MHRLNSGPSMRPLILAALTLAVLCGATALQQPRAAYACSCLAPPAPQAARDASAAVFVGTVSGLAPAGPNGEALFVTFDLTQSWKGPAASQLTLTTAGSSAACGFAFTQGEAYLVYSVAQDGGLSTGLCSRTASLADAEADLAALGPGTAVTAAPAPVTAETMEVPWVPILIVGAVLLMGAALFGPGLMRRRAR